MAAPTINSRTQLIFSVFHATIYDLTHTGANDTLETTVKCGQECPDPSYVAITTGARANGIVMADPVPPAGKKSITTFTNSAAAERAIFIAWGGT